MINMAIGKDDIDQLAAIVSLIEEYRKLWGSGHIYEF
jgi:hypothetical protein